MQALFSIYAVTILAATVLGAALASLGTQLAARDRAMQTLCISQGAMLGVLLGLGIFTYTLDHMVASNAGPFVLGFLIAAATSYVSERLAATSGSSNNTHFAALFAVLLACGYLISALFPMLESHMSQKYFGDLATLSRGESLAALGLGVALLPLSLIFRRHLTRDSFAIAILGTPQNATRWGGLFAVISLLVLCFCIQTVGFLFTVACLFIPTSVLSFGERAGLTRHISLCALVGGAATFSGFILSLIFSHLPTVPTIIAVMTLVAGLLTYLGKPHDKHA